MKNYICILVIFISLKMNAQCFQKFSSNSSHSIVIKDDGTLWAWGKNSQSEVGVCNGQLPVFGPTQLSNQPVWTKVFTGSNKTFAIKNDGTLWACGNGSGGSLGTGNQNDVCTLTQIGTDVDWNEIYPGSGTIAKKNNGTLWGWGSNIYGQLNIGTTSLQFTPVQISTETNWSKINMSLHTIALKNNGTLWACGLNDKGQIGDGTQINRLNFVQIGSNNNWSDIASGYLGKQSYALKSDGTFWGWGYNESMIFGSGGNVLQPIQLGTSNDWSKISGTNLGVVLTKQNGTLWYYSSSGFQQIGIDTNWVNIYGGFAHFFASKSDGTHWGYGSNQDGQLGLGSAITTTSVMTLFNCLAFLNVEEINPLVNLMIYPNPTNEYVFIENNSHKNINKIYLTNINGKVLLEERNDFSKIYVGNFENGIYFLNISSENETFSYKIVKK